MITVFGSVNVDLVTRVPHIPAPGETVLGERHEVVPGGKGANQALAARRAGAAVRLAGAVGRDGFSDIALRLLEEEEVDLSAVERVDAGTGLATIAVDPWGENAIVVSSGANRLASADRVPATGAGDTLVLQMEVPAAETRRAAETARAAGARVILSLAPFAPIERDYLEPLDILVMNEGEALSLAAHLDLEPGNAGEAAARLAASTGLTVVATLGAVGALACLADGTRLEVPALAVEAVDTTGAGDTFVGVLAARLDRGASMGSALRWAAVGASLACTRFGAQTSFPTQAEIEAVL